jgi:hypothetical protein
MTDKQVKVTAAQRLGRILVRVGAVMLVALAIGAALNRISASMERSLRPAGFSRGILQGALMPMAMPNLLVGRDVTIYSQNNTGVSYKLGYTTGVNGCGAIFFGFFFWRVNQWKRKTSELHLREKG